MHHHANGLIHRLNILCKESEECKSGDLVFFANSRFDRSLSHVGSMTNKVEMTKRGNVKKSS